MIRDCRTIMVLLLLAVGAGCSREPAEPEPPVSAEGLKWRAAEALVATLTPQAIAPEGMQEFAKMPAPMGCYDCFGYALHVNPANGEYWLHQTGGFAGVWQWYGPLDPRYEPAARLLKLTASTDPAVGAR